MATTMLSNNQNFLLLRFLGHGICTLRHFQESAGLFASHRHPGKESKVEIMDDGLPKDYRLQAIKLSSRRLDALVSRTIGKGRGQAEKLILMGKVQVNDHVAKKAAYYIQDSDIIDIWKEPVEGNADLAEVHRIEIISYAITEEGYDVNLKSWKKFFVHNWLNK